MSSQVYNVDVFMRDRTTPAAFYFAGLTLAYLVLVMTLPNHQAQTTYHLSTVQYHILLFFVVVPLLVVWLVAFYGYSRLREYTQIVRSAPEGQAFSDLTRGAMWLAWGQPIPAIISLVLSSIAGSHANFAGATSIINNYINLLIALVAYSYFSSAGRRLAEREKVRISLSGARMLIVVFVSFGVTFCYFVFRNLSSSNLGSSNNAYNLPTWLLLASLVIPYLYAWFAGLLAAYEVHLVSQHSKGLLYQRALQQISRGLVIIIASSIFIQFLRSISPSGVQHFSLGNILLLIYCLLIIMGLGFFLLAYGANRLRKIEEV